MERDITLFRVKMVWDGKCVKLLDYHNSVIDMRLASTEKSANRIMEKLEKEMFRSAGAMA